MYFENFWQVQELELKSEKYLNVKEKCTSTSISAKEVLKYNTSIVLV